MALSPPTHTHAHTLHTPFVPTITVNIVLTTTPRYIIQRVQRMRFLKGRKEQNKTADKKNENENRKKKRADGRHES